MSGVFLMLVNYLHDLAVALMAANVLCVFYIGRILEGRPVADTVLPGLYRRLSRITYGALAYVLVGGAIRAFTFREFEWNAAVGNGQVPALVVKHVLLVGLTAFGLVTQFRYRGKFRGSV